MADYRETNLTGVSWRRCYQVRISNPYKQLPSVDFLEQDIAEIGGRQVDLGGTSVQVKFDPNREFDILDPTTLLPTGQKLTYQIMYGLILSAYIDAAKERDLNG